MDPELKKEYLQLQSEYNNVLRNSKPNPYLKVLIEHLKMKHPTNKISTEEEWKKIYDEYSFKR